MIATPKALTRGLLSASSATLYTVPSSTTTVITNIVLSNTSATAATATIALDGVVLVPGVSIPANNSFYVDLRQALGTTKAITGFASSASVVACHISGAETT